MKTISEGFCQCGCGNITKTAERTQRRFGWEKGKPFRFIHGHNTIGESNPAWKGGKIIDDRGYVMTLFRSHPRSKINGYIYDHILVAERALGKPLSPAAQIHHFPNIKDWTNLIICQDHVYHRILEARYRALRACGHAHWRKCSFCKKWDDPQKMYIYPASYKAIHRNCQNNYKKDRKQSHQPTL